MEALQAPLNTEVLYPHWMPQHSQVQYVRCVVFSRPLLGLVSLTSCSSLGSQRSDRVPSAVLGGDVWTGGHR